MAKGIEINKVKNEYIKYLMFRPESHITTRPLNPISIEVPKSGWDITSKIGRIRIINEKNICLKVLTSRSWTR
jgi:hypothetical protein